MAYISMTITQMMKNRAMFLKYFLAISQTLKFPFESNEIWINRNLSLNLLPENTFK